MKKSSKRSNYLKSQDASSSDPALLSQRIEKVRQVARRVKVSNRSEVLDPVISKKLEQGSDP